MKKIYDLKVTNIDETEGFLVLYKRLEEKRNFITIDDEIKWNFTKFLVSKKGNVIKRYYSTARRIKKDEFISSFSFNVIFKSTSKSFHIY